MLVLRWVHWMLCCDFRPHPGEPAPDCEACFLAASYSPRALAMISLAIDSGTSLYAWNCIEYVARP